LFSHPLPPPPPPHRRNVLSVFASAGVKFYTLKLRLWPYTRRQIFINPFQFLP
jgi:hypothetical protein